MKIDKVLGMTITKRVTGFKIAYMYDESDTETEAQNVNQRGNFPVIDGNEKQADIQKKIEEIFKYVEEVELNKNK